MSAINFPINPNDGDVYAPNGTTADYWMWSLTGGYWKSIKVRVSTLNGLSGSTQITAGSNITISLTGQSIKIDAVGGGAIGNLDGGTPTSVYGGITPIDCGGV